MIVSILALAVALSPQAQPAAAGSNLVVSIIDERVGEDFSVRFVMSGAPTSYSATPDGDSILVRIDAMPLPGLTLPSASGPIRSMTLEPGPAFALRITLRQRIPHQMVREAASLRLVLRDAMAAVVPPSPAATPALDPMAMLAPSPEPTPPPAPDPVAVDTADLYGRLFPSMTDASSVGRLGGSPEPGSGENWYSDTTWLGFQVRPWVTVTYVDAKTTEVLANHVTADQYWMIQPNFGVGFSPRFGGDRVGQWSVNYTPRFRRAFDQEIPHLTSHFVDARIDQSVTASLKIYGTYHYSQGVLETDEIDPGREYGIGRNRVLDSSLERFKRNSFGAGVTFDFLADTEVDVNVGATRVDYGNDPGEETGTRAFFDYDARTLNASLRRGLGESRFLGLVFGVHDAPTQPEREQVEGRGYSYGVTLDGEIATLTTGRIALGYRTQRNPNAGLGGQDYGNFTFGAQIVREISEDTSLGLGAERNLYLSAFEDNGFYVADIFRGDFTTRLPFAIFFRGGLGYQTSNYETSPQAIDSAGTLALRKDKLLLWSVSLTRSLTDWAYLRFDYLGDRRDSNLDGFDIKSRSLSFQLGLGAFGKTGHQGAPIW